MKKVKTRSAGTLSCYPLWFRLYGQGVSRSPTFHFDRNSTFNLFVSLEYA